MRNFSPLLIALSLTLSAPFVWAYPYNDSRSDLTPGLTLNGIETRTNGTVETYNIPITNWQNVVAFNLRGGDGGRARANAAVGQDKSAAGGGGSSIIAGFTIDPVDVNALKPGGEIRIIVASKGTSQQGPDDITAGGGGGATGVLYRAPVEGADWELLMIAGGGGGGAASTNVASTFADDGQDANTGTSGDDAGSAAPGGDNGQNGLGWTNGSGGGAGWLDSAPGSKGGANWANGGAGGSPNHTGVSGGFGIAGGGAGHRRATFEEHEGGGGGGGGYSGGGGGNDDANNAWNEGGGGGSFVDSRALMTFKSTRSGNEQNGSANVIFSGAVTSGLSGPSMTLTGSSSIEILYNEFYVDPGATAQDLYGNDLNVVVSVPADVGRDIPGDYTVSYVATDQFGASTTLTRSLTILSNRSPSAPTLSGTTVTENTSNVGTLLSTDPDGETVSYSISGGSDRPFFEIINGNTLVFASAPDFENPRDMNSDNVYIVEVEATDGSSAPQETRFEVTVTGSDEAPTAPTISQTTILENTTQVGTLLSTDPEGATVSFTIAGGADQALFEIINNNTLAFKSAPDFETPQDLNANNVHNIKIVASDGVTTTQEISFKVTVQDVNEAPAAPSLSQTTLLENATQVGTLSSSDVEGDAISFAITGGADQALFEIINSNVLAFKSAPDFDDPQDSDDNNVYNVIIEAADNSSSSEGSAFQVTVQNIDEEPTAPSISQTTISENTTQVGTLLSTDPEGVDLTFTIIGGADQALFEIINSNVLAFKSAPDFEDPQDSDDNNVYNVTVEVSDGTTTPQEGALQVTVQDSNEAPTNPTLTRTDILENTTVVGTLSSTDPDGDSLTYFISQGVDESLFEIINGNVLAFKEAPDFENRQDHNTDNEYVVRVRTNDSTNLSGNPIFRIRVTDVNEAPSSPVLSSTEVSENSTTVLTLTSTDPDNDTLSYVIGGGVDQALFSITGDVLSFKTAPDFEAPSDQDSDGIYQVTISARDGSLSSEASALSVTVTNVAELAIEEFRSTYGLATDGSEDSADFSENGVPNLFYLAFDLGDPNETEIDRTRLPIVEEGPLDNSVRITYYTRNNVDLNYEVYRSNEISTWTAESEFLEAERALGTSTTILADGLERITKVFPAPTSDVNCFYRVGVTQQNQVHQDARKPLRASNQFTKT